ncbi:hypothetical protein ABPG75_003029 [Micractinium tetrahymenae]
MDASEVDKLTFETLEGLLVQETAFRWRPLPAAELPPEVAALKPALYQSGSHGAAALAQAVDATQRGVLLLSGVAATTLAGYGTILMQALARSSKPAAFRAYCPQLAAQCEDSLLPGFASRVLPSREPSSNIKVVYGPSWMTVSSSSMIQRMDARMAAAAAALEDSG